MESITKNSIENYRKYGVDTAKDFFFTTADLNPVSVKYTGTNSNIDRPMYKIKLKSSTNTNYYLTATDKSSESLPQIVTDEDSAKSWTFRMLGSAGDIPEFTDEAVNKELENIKNWGLVKRNGQPKLIILDIGI